MGKKLAIFNVERFILFNFDSKTLNFIKLSIISHNAILLILEKNSLKNPDNNSNVQIKKSELQPLTIPNGRTHLDSTQPSLNVCKLWWKSATCGCGHALIIVTPLPIHSYQKSHFQIIFWSGRFNFDYMLYKTSFI